MTDFSAPFIPFVIETSWQKTLQEELQKPYMVQLATFIESERAFSPHPIYPPSELMFNAFYQTPFDSVKVLIMGQDPYHGYGQAHGLSFSVPPGIKPPPSLMNIYKELKDDLGITKENGCLMGWAKQGVMLLNATLTVREGEPLSHHGKGWEQFTDAVVHKLAEREDPVIFVLWGKSAQEKCRFVTLNSTKTTHCVLTAAHPSPFSAHNGFLGCRHFSKINDFLEKQGKKAINWAL